jgi:signal transduction histidine kinase
LATLISTGRLTGSKDRMIKRAQTFFVESLTRIEKTHPSAMEANLELNKLNQTVQQRSKTLAAKNRELKQEITERRAAEKALKQSKKNYGLLLKQSEHMQEQLKRLSRQVLTAQEEERMRISHELHDEVAQVMTGINLHLTTLKKEAAATTKDLQTTIVRTQRLVEKSVDIVHRFAGQLRPPVLDDLGLFPALHAYITEFSKQTGLSIRFTSFTRSRINNLDNAKRIVLYRVAQEALTNVGKHAKANLVTVSIQKIRRTIHLEIRDDGKSFKVKGRLLAGKKKGLGLIGMRERVEMVNGCFSVESSPGKGTTIRAEIPLDIKK